MTTYKRGVVSHLILVHVTAARAFCRYRKYWAQSARVEDLRIVGGESN